LIYGYSKVARISVSYPNLVILNVISREHPPKKNSSRN
jgi:hypothetical protein